MSIPYLAYAIGASVLTCAIGAFGMRFYFVRNREIADREDPRDTQIRDLQATLQVVRKEAAARKVEAEEATSHLEFAHDRINELLERSNDLSEKLDSVKEMLRTKIADREEMADQLSASQRELDGVKDRLQEAELELSMASESGDMLDPAKQSTGGTTMQTAIRVSDAERRQFQDKLTKAENKMSAAEKVTADLKVRLQDAEAKAASPAPAQMSDSERQELEEKLAAAEAKLVAAEKDAATRVSAARKDAEVLGAANRKGADDKLKALQGRFDNAEAKLAAARQDAESRVASVRKDSEQKLSAIMDKLDDAEAKLTTVEQEAEATLAEAMKESAAKLSAAQSKLSSLVTRLSKSESKLSDFEKDAQTRIAAANAKLEAAQKAADENASVAEKAGQVKLQDAEKKIVDLEQRLRNAEHQINASAETNELTRPALRIPGRADSAAHDGDNGSGLYRPTVEDGDPSLVECLTEELDRWKRHCHVLGDELKQHREQQAQIPAPILTPPPMAAPAAPMPPQAKAANAPEQLAPTVSQPAPSLGRGQPEPALPKDAPRQDEEIFARIPGPKRKSGSRPASKPAPASETAHTPRAGNGAGGVDELTEIKGIGAVIAGKLNDCGIHRYDQLAALSSEELDRILKLVPDFEHRMKRYDYMQQALTLHSNKYNDRL